jgi:hypothetical protein
VVRWSLMWRSMTALNARKSTRLKCTFSRCFLDAIFV